MFSHRSGLLNYGLVLSPFMQMRELALTFEGAGCRGCNQPFLAHLGGRIAVQNQRPYSGRSLQLIGTALTDGQTVAPAR
jgi:hypothetical protein